MVFAHKKSTWLHLVFGAVLAAFALPALAQIPGLNFIPTAGDKSLELLGYVFGGATDSVPGSSPIIAAVLGIFNGAILSLASLVAFYTIVSAVVQTAHDGEVLGKRYSSLWVPIRAATGIAAIVPAGGYSAVQIMVLWIAAQGVGLADTIYNAGLSALAGNGGFKPPAVIQEHQQTIATDMIPLAACVVKNLDLAEKAKVNARQVLVPSTDYNVIGVAGGGPAGNLTPTRSPTSTVFHVTVVSDGAIDSRGGVPIECGKIDIRQVKSDNKYAQSSAGSIHTQQVAAVKQMYERIYMVAQATHVGTTKEAIAAAIDSAKVEYAARMNAILASAQASAAGQARADYQAAIRDLQSKGWATAGMSYMHLSRISSDVSTAAQVGVVTATWTFRSIFQMSDDEFMAGVGKIVDSVKESVEAYWDASFEGKTEKHQQASNWLWDKLMSNVNSLTISYIQSFTTTNTGDPVLDMKFRGDSMLVLVGTIMGAAAAVGAIGGASSLGTLSGVIAGLMTFVSVLCFALFTMGLTLAVYVPMLPYIIWIGVLMAWVVAVAEAILASPLWMMMHINPDGEGIATGATEAGYKFVAAVFLRPALSVISFFIAALILIAFSTFINETFMEVFKSIQSNTNTGLFLLIGFCGAYVAIMLSVVNRAFGLCASIPEAILRWIGTNMTGGEALDRDAGGQFNAIAGGVSQAAGRGSDRASAGKAKPPAMPGGGGGGGGSPATDAMDGKQDGAAAAPKPPGDEAKA